MIALDTNVVSEVMRLGGNPIVLKWLDGQEANTIFLPTPALGELLFGIQALPRGRRRAELASALREVLARRFTDRLLSFDQPAAEFFAVFLARARAMGRTIGIIDGQIAAITASHGFTVATRDTAPFLATGIPVIDPWQHP